MIGVAASADRIEVVNEFFELFKTPWEPFVPGKRYPVVLIADGHTDPGDAEVAFADGPRPTRSITVYGSRANSSPGRSLSAGAIRYCRCTALSRHSEATSAVGCSRSTAARWITERPSAV